MENSPPSFSCGNASPARIVFCDRFVIEGGIVWTIRGVLRLIVMAEALVSKVGDTTFPRKLVAVQKPRCKVRRWQGRGRDEDSTARAE